MNWTSSALLPYVAHVDERRQPTDWLFDSFLFLEIKADNGASFYHYAPGKVQATAADWQELAESWFRKETGLAGLETAVDTAGRALSDTEHRVNVVISLPTPLRPIKQFGPLAGQAAVLDFSKDSDRLAAVKWYTDRVLTQWSQQRYRHLRLVGFYWTAESIPASDNAIVESTAAHVHSLGYKLFWIPYFGSQGWKSWRDRGIDVAMLQPNYFFPEKVELDRLTQTARNATEAQCGVEIEFDGRVFDSREREDRFWAYLDAGVRYGWMQHAVLGYYEGGGSLGALVSRPGAGRAMYDALYRFVQGTYEPSGRVHLKAFDVATHPASATRAAVP